MKIDSVEQKIKASIAALEGKVAVIDGKVFEMKVRIDELSNKFSEDIQKAPQEIISIKKEQETANETITKFGYSILKILDNLGFESFKQFKRFKTHRHYDGWAVGLDKWDAIIFEAKRDVKVYAIGVYAASDDK